MLKYALGKYEIDKLPPNHRVAIYGAGELGMIARAYIEEKRPDIKIVCFFDKSPYPDRFVYPYINTSFQVFHSDLIEKFQESFDTVIIASKSNYLKMKQTLIDCKITKHIHFVDGFFIGRHSSHANDLVRNNPNTTIGSFCSIADNVTLGPCQHPTNFLSTHNFQFAYGYLNEIHDLVEFKNMCRPVFVGNDVWIGRNVVVQDTVTIGDGAIIGSNAVVTKDVPPYAIVGGVPAKIIRYRFEQNIIDKLLELKWWNLEDSQIAKLPFNDIEKCIEILQEIRNKH